MNQSCRRLYVRNGITPSKCRWLFPVFYGNELNFGDSNTQRPLNNRIYSHLIPMQRSTCLCIIHASPCIASSDRANGNFLNKKLAFKVDELHFVDPVFCQTHSYSFSFFSASLFVFSVCFLVWFLFPFLLFYSVRLLSAGRIANNETQARILNTVQQHAYSDPWCCRSSHIFVYLWAGI